MGEYFSKTWSEFNHAGFVAMATNNFDALELKERSAQITEALTAFLPDNFEHATAVMLASLAPDESNDINDMTMSDHGIAGWAVMPMVEGLSE